MKVAWASLRSNFPSPTCRILYMRMPIFSNPRCGVYTYIIIVTRLIPKTWPGNILLLVWLSVFWWYNVVLHIKKIHLCRLGGEALFLFLFVTGLVFFMIIITCLRWHHCIYIKIHQCRLWSSWLSVLGLITLGGEALSSFLVFLSCNSRNLFSFFCRRFIQLTIRSPAEIYSSLSSYVFFLSSRYDSRHIPDLNNSHKEKQIRWIHNITV